eukprot:TRINITY_DN30085_c0_g1_i1.p2 TRINITY_DN30085_c0_g1~~TRINITY_DN30085_c0_g1_i1.p2  ORF type:complete len:579 (+),score=228.50 TRINITY_DN30085_c0_g1_i1:147-1883(+)
MTVATGFKLLQSFLDTVGLGQYGDMFYQKGVTIDNFHKLTEKELNRMRLTNSALIKRLLQLSGRKENVKFKRMKQQASKRKRDPMQRFQATARKAEAAGGVSMNDTAGDSPTSPHSPDGGDSPARRKKAEYDPLSHQRPTASQCLGQATTFIPPTPMKQSRIVEDYRNARYAREGERTDTGCHIHGVSGSHCGICAELNHSTGVQRSRKEMYPFPDPTTQGPEYPEAEYDFALQFRLLQLSIDVADIHQMVWDEENAERDEMYQFFRCTIEAALAAERLEIEDEEEAVRAEILKEEKFIYKELMKAAICATVDSRKKYIDDLQKQQRQTLCHVELHERSCREAEEESEILQLIEIGAHLHHLLIKEQRDRLREIDAMDYRTRCPVCWKRKCTFHQHPWRTWSKRPTESGFSSYQSTSTSAKLREDTIKGLAGRCKDAGVFSDYEQFANQSKAMRPHIYKTKKFNRGPNKIKSGKEGLSSLRKKIDSARQTDSQTSAAQAAATTPAAAAATPAAAHPSARSAYHTAAGSHPTPTPPPTHPELNQTAMSSSQQGLNADELGHSPTAHMPRPPTPPGTAVA